MNENCKIYFGSVRSDICETCERLRVDLVAARRKNDTPTIARLDREKELHLSQAHSFYAKLTAYKEKPDPSTLTICMDLKKNCRCQSPMWAPDTTSDSCGFIISG